ncbi:hypothetical protein SAMN05720469_1683 [Fibrobacter intestinalis]|uniref:Uncharacterized protein n=1 Tax=Fibrobacter intestinalis TaxID=28122 RepID=A0A1M6ZPR9_9BACT|nr:hypothetical protein [Fibrobacter intestinalis]SHL32434.1 hypothetical protein SAMN05720469_1683 [Fibrobacter intestinalis]
MALIDQFKKLYDKIKPLTNTHISEQDPQASLRHVEVQLTSSDYICYDQNLTKGKLGLENLSSSLMKNECDGIIISEKGNIALHFVELKSNFDTHDIDKAIKQTFSSFVKLLMMLSVCDFDVDKCCVFFVIVCQTFANDDQKTSIEHAVSQMQQIGENSYQNLFLQAIQKSQMPSTIKLKIGEIPLIPEELKNKISTKILGKEVTISLFLTSNYGDSICNIAL